VRLALSRQMRGDGLFGSLCKHVGVRVRFKILGPGESAGPAMAPVLQTAFRLSEVWGRISSARTTTHLYQGDLQAWCLVIFSGI
jgi:hypothetical protein